MTKLADVIQRGTNGARPAASAVPVGTLYYDTTNSSLGRSNGTTWDSVEGAGTSPSGSITASGYTQTTARLLGRTTASTGAIEEITVGTGLTLSGGSLTASGSSGAARPLDASAAGSGGDLFSGASLDGGWSNLQTTGLTSNDRPRSGVLVQNNTGNTGGADRGLQRAFSPSADFEVMARLDGARLTGDFQWAGIFAGAATPGDGAGGNRIQLIIVRNSGGSGYHLKFSKIAAGSETNVFDSLFDSVGKASIPASTNSPFPFPIWLRIKRVSTTLTGSISFDGGDWVDQATTTTISFTVTTCGLLIGESSASSDIRGAWGFIATTG